MYLSAVEQSDSVVKSSVEFLFITVINLSISSMTSSLHALLVHVAVLKFSFQQVSSSFATNFRY